MNDNALNAAKKPNEDLRPAGVSPFPGVKVIPKEALNRWHNLIVSNIAAAIGSRVHGNKSELYVNGMRVQLRNNLLCYPDVAVISGEPRFADQNSEVLLNPTVVVEIVSNTTNPTLKTQKLEAYMAMESIRECIVIKADEMRIEQYSKQNPKQWIYKIYNERDDIVSIDSINCKVSLAEIYSQINFREAQMSARAGA